MNANKGVHPNQGVYPMQAQAQEILYKTLNARGIYLLNVASRISKVQQAILTFLQNNPIFQDTAIWVQPFMHTQDLITYIIEEQSNNNKQIYDQLFLKYKQDFHNYSNFYEQIINIKIGSQPVQAQPQRSYKRRQDQDRRRDIKRAEQAKKAQQARKAQQLRKAQQARRMEQIRQQQERKRQQQERKRQQQLRRPKIIQFQHRSFDNFVALFDVLVTDEVCLSKALLADLKAYKSRPTELQYINQIAFVERYGERKGNKNLTIKPGQQRPTQQIMRGSGVKQSVNVVKVGGLMRAVQDPELTKLKQAIKTQKDFVERQKQSIKNQQDQYRRQSKFKLNQLTPQNFDVLLNDFKALAFQNSLSCRLLVQQIIVMAWHQQKYCSTYAKLCQILDSLKMAQISKYVKEQLQKSGQNPFHFKLIEQVQKIFAQKIEIPVFQSKAQQQLFLVQIKKKKIGNIKFIAQLLRLNILKKFVTRYCFIELLKNYLLYTGVRPDAQDNIQSIIVLFDRIGQHIEKSQKGVVATNQFEQNLIKQTDSFVKSGQKQKLLALLSETESDSVKLTLNGYFSVINCLQKYQKLSYRLRALLKNLNQKKERGWVDIYSNEGPKKLAQVHDQDQQQQALLSSEQIRQRIEKQLSRYRSGEERDLFRGLGNIIDRSKQEEMLYMFMTVVCQDRQQNIKKRKNILFDFIVQEKLSKTFLNTWVNRFKLIACLSSDQPFLAAYLAQTLLYLIQQNSIRLSELKLIFLEEQEEEKQFFEEIMAKLVNLDKRLLKQVKQLLQDVGSQLDPQDCGKLSTRNMIE